MGIIYLTIDYGNMKALKTKWNRDNGCCLLIHHTSRYTDTWQLISSKEYVQINKFPTSQIALLDNAEGPMLAYNITADDWTYLDNYKLW